MPPEEPVLAVIPVLLDENLLDRRQIAEEKCLPAGKIERDEVAVPTGYSTKNRNGSLPSASRFPRTGKPDGPGG
jgi:hypothetical protein